MALEFSAQGLSNSMWIRDLFGSLNWRLAPTMHTQGT